MKPNFTLDVLDRLKPDELAALPVEVLADLQAMLATMKYCQDRWQAIWWAEIDRRFAAQANAIRLADGRDTGVAHVVEGDFDVESTIPKKVEWDARKLRAALSQMSKEDTAHYAVIKLSIDERKYVDAPPAIKKLLEPARTVRSGKAAYKLKRIEN